MLSNFLKTMASRRALKTVGWLVDGAGKTNGSVMPYLKRADFKNEKLASNPEDKTRCMALQWAPVFEH